MKKTLYFLLAFVATPAISQDSLVYFSDLTYSSDFEASVFEAYFRHNEHNYLALFLAADPEMEKGTFQQYEAAFKSKINSIDIAKLNRKKTDKKVKTLYEDVHDQFLTKYEIQNDFSSIFSKGHYNCVSASALYGIIFSKLDIPYIIKEKPTHVYLVAYPGSEKILVESTDPNGGFITSSDKYKQAFVEQMTNAKLISAEEAKTKSVPQLFDEYYFGDPDITLKELVGIQYTNHALYSLEKEDYKKAYTLLEKAFFFYPADRVITLLIAVNIDIIQKSDYSSSEDILHLAKLSRFTDYGISHDMIIGEFSRINNIHLINKGDAETYEKYYKQLVSLLHNEDLKHSISYLYYYERGRVLYNQGKYNEALPFFSQAYELKSENLEINNAIVSAIAQSLRFESNNTLIIERLESYGKKYPQLMNNNVFKSMLVNSYLIQCGQSYDLRNINEATKYKALFEKNYTQELNVDASNIGRVYSLAAIYYFRKGYTSKAVNIIAKGLEYAPGNYELLMRQKMIR
ncbi:tetratricopeptide repeat protein [Fulvivirga sp. 29W222]|uniref:Tetratricopeptide repeat protein n=1 Tax=Fulvivirga marina TaxID=2494733 RepID=A0A937G4J5_9BACT|nr:tetratricopeptide repeat protein [Fulvivirga marina]MBL6449888.1 tetratricopeptide repeat protein [Fulvivirga marina]